MSETAAPLTAPNRPLPRRDDVEVWLFDLDNTLYPASCNLFPQVERRMGEFICQRFSMDAAEAKALQKRLFREHGTTLRGLMTEFAVEARQFLDFVHDVDLSAISTAPALDRVLAELPGRKLIYTNADQPYTERVLERLGVARHFEGIFDIVAADYQPKPQEASYEALLQRYDFDPSRAIFFEDSARNLKPAHALGMTTVWIEHDAEWSGTGIEDGTWPDWVHHRGDDLLTWLQDLHP